MAFSALLPTARAPGPHNLPVRIVPLSAPAGGRSGFTQPIPLPAGTRIDMVAVFDNSAENLRQPNRPPRPVSWGDGTTDEMAIVFLGVTVDGEHIGWRPR